MSVHAFGSTEYLKDIERLTAQGSKKAAGAPAAVNLVRADGVRPEPIKWLWRGWIARGKLHVLAGAPGTGKTSAAVALAATVTIGGRWPDGTIADPGDVFIWSGEDDIKDTLVPRLIAARADLKRVHFVSGITEDGKTRSFDPATHGGRCVGGTWADFFCEKAKPLRSVRCTGPQRGQEIEVGLEAQRPIAVVWARPARHLEIRHLEGGRIRHEGGGRVRHYRGAVTGNQSRPERASQHHDQCSREHNGPHFRFAVH